MRFYSIGLAYVWASLCRTAALGERLHVDQSTNRYLRFLQKLGLKTVYSKSETDAGNIVFLKHWIQIKGAHKKLH